MIKIFCICAAAFLLNSCALRLLTRIASTDLALVRGVGVRSAASGFAVTNEIAAFSRLSRIRILSRTSKQPMLYTIENGKMRYLAELLNESTIRSVASKMEYSLPFRIFKTRAGVLAELRTGPGVHYKVFKTIPKDQLVLVLEESGPWFKVKINELTGWILATSIISTGQPVNAPGLKIPVYIKTACEICTNKGEYGCFICHDKGEEKCIKCNGEGHTSCKACKGIGKVSCKNCKNEGYILCSICKNKNSENCLSCRGLGKSICINCNGEKSFDCIQCKGQGKFDCKICHSAGNITCDACDGTKNLKCYFCFGSGYYMKRVY